jgi:hypothetical protein
MRPFTVETVREALAEASVSLRAAGVTGVWLYMDGWGWTQTYTLTVEEAEPLIEMVVPVNREEAIPVTRLRSPAKEAVEGALAGLDLDKDTRLIFIGRESFVRRTDEQVWPARDLIETVEALLAALQARLAYPEEPRPMKRAIVLKPPTGRLDPGTPSLFLAGSIEMGAASDWQAATTEALADLPIAILNPRRDSWDASWVQDISNAPFRGQVEWELDHLEAADVVLFHFEPTTKSPITLLELGLMASRDPDRLVVSCPPGFWRRGNIQIVCDRFNIPLFDTLSGALSATRDLLVARIAALPEGPCHDGAGT